MRPGFLKALLRFRKTDWLRFPLRQFFRVDASIFCHQSIFVHIERTIGQTNICTAVYRSLLKRKNHRRLHFFFSSPNFGVRSHG